MPSGVVTVIPSSNTRRNEIQNLPSISFVTTVIHCPGYSTDLGLLYSSDEPFTYLLTAQVFMVATPFLDLEI